MATWESIVAQEEGLRKARIGVTPTTARGEGPSGGPPVTNQPGQSAPPPASLSQEDLLYDEPEKAQEKPPAEPFTDYLKRVATTAGTGTIHKSWKPPPTTGFRPSVVSSPGGKGAELAKLLVEFERKQPDMMLQMSRSPTKDSGGWGTWIRDTAKTLKKRERGLSDKDAIERANRLASARVLVGDAVQGYYKLPEDSPLDDTKVSVPKALGRAFGRQVEIVGFNERGGTIVPRVESKLHYLFRLADTLQTAGTGATIGISKALGEGKNPISEETARELIAGIRDYKIAYDGTESIIANSEFVQKHPYLQLQLKKAGVAMTVLTPTAFTALGPIIKGARYGVRQVNARRFNRGTDEIIEELTQAKAAIDRGDSTEASVRLKKAADIEKAQRKHSKAGRDSVNMEEARLAGKEIERGDPHRIGDVELAQRIPGEAGQDLTTMNPAARRRMTEIEGVQAQDFNRLFGLRKAHDDLVAEELRLQREIARATAAARAAAKETGKGGAKAVEAAKKAVTETTEAHRAVVDEIMDRRRELQWRQEISVIRNPASDLADVQRGQKAVYRNIELRLQANKNIKEALKGGVSGKGASGVSEVFNIREATKARHALDVVVDEARAVSRGAGSTQGMSREAVEAAENVRSPDALLSALQASESPVLVPDTKRIHDLRSRIDMINKELSEVPDLSVSQLNKLEDDLRKASGELRKGPVTVLSRRDLSELQAKLESGARAGTGLSSPSLRQKGDLLAEERLPIQNLEADVEALSEAGARYAIRNPGLVGGIVKGLSNAPLWTKRMIFGANADKDIARFPMEIQHRMKAGIRWIDQAASDFNLLIGDGGGRILDYISGLPVKFLNGSAVHSSGFDSVLHMQNRIMHRLERLEDSLPGITEGLTNTATRINKEGTGWIHRLRAHTLSEPAGEGQRVVEEIQAFWRGDEFLDELLRSVVGRQPSPNQILNPPELELMENLLFYSGQSWRHGTGKFTGTSREAAEALFGKNGVIARIYRQSPNTEVVGAQTVAVFGSVEDSMKTWRAVDVAIPDELQRPFGEFLQGKTLTDDQWLRIKPILEEHGLGPAFKAMEDITGVDDYVPAALRRRIVEALDRTLARGRIRSEAPVNAMNLTQAAIQMEKSRLVRGNLMARAKYFHYNSWDRFMQLAMEAGFQPAIVNTARQSLLELSALPGLENLLRSPLLGVSPEVRGGAVAESLRRALQTQGDKVGNLLGKLFGNGGLRVEVEAILEGGDELIKIGDKWYTRGHLRKIGVEEGAASSFDNTALARVILNNAERTHVPIIGHLRGGMADITGKNAATIAEGISLRERHGAAVTLMEAGIDDPRLAYQISTRAYYDYATSVAKTESPSHAFGMVLNTVEPYWAYKKNAARQMYNVLNRPSSVYRMDIMRRIIEQGSDIASDELYDYRTDMFGIQVGAIEDPDLLDRYMEFKQLVVKTYDGKVPDEVIQTGHALFSGSYAGRQKWKGRQFEMAGGGEEAQKIRDFMRANDFSALRSAYSPPPDKSSLPSYAKDRGALVITPNLENEALREYYASQPAGQKSVVAYLTPPDTIHAGLNHIAFTMHLEMAMMKAVADPSDHRWTPAIGDYVGKYWDVSRAPIVGPLVTSTMAAKDTARGERISSTLANRIEDYFPGVVCPSATFGQGDAKTTVYWMPPGPGWYAAHAAVSGSVDTVARGWENVPVTEHLGHMGTLLKTLSATRGHTMIEFDANRSATGEIPRVLTPAPRGTLTPYR